MRPQDIPDTERERRWRGLSADEIAARDAEIVRRYNAEDAKHVSMSALAREYNMTLGNVSRIINRAAGRYWAVRPKQPCPYL